MRKKGTVVRGISRRDRSAPGGTAAVESLNQIRGGRYPGGPEAAVQYLLGFMAQLESQIAEHKMTISACVLRAEQLREVLKFFSHQDGCSSYEWADPADHIETSFGFRITAAECSCGAIAAACLLEPGAGARLARHPRVAEEGPGPFGRP